MSTESQAANTPIGPGLAAWTLGLLTAVSFFNYMDRMVLSVLLQPIKLEFHLSDSQLGLLTGLAFALFYAVLGMPLARLADRRSRVTLLTICLAVWSLMTAATGLARSFGQLFLARTLVGVGEAGGVPAAHSILGDLYPHRRRAFAISIYQAGGLAGFAGGMLLAGALADRWGWRPALWAVGLPGVALAGLIRLTVSEPRRAQSTSGAAPEQSVAAMAALLRRPGLRGLMAALSAGSFATYALSQWAPTFFVRSHHMSLTQIGFATGLAGGIAGAIGALGGGAIASPLLRRDPRWELWWPAIAYGGSAPLYLGMLLAPSAWAAVVLQFLGTLLASSGLGVAMSAVQAFAEPSRRATAVALTLLSTAVLGLGAGPLTVGVLSDALAPQMRSESLHWALLTAPAALVISGLVFFFAGRTAPAEDVNQAEAA